MSLKEFGGELGIATERVESGPGREVAENVRVVSKPAIGKAAGCNFPLRVDVFRVVVFIDVAPPALRMADEIHGGKSLEHFVKSLEFHIVIAIPEMEEDGDIKVFRNACHAIEVR